MVGISLRVRLTSFFVILALALSGCKTTDFGKMLEQDGQTETASLPTQEEEEKRISWAIYTLWTATREVHLG